MLAYCFLGLRELNPRSGAKGLLLGFMLQILVAFYSVPDSQVITALLLGLGTVTIRTSSKYRVSTLLGSMS